MNQTHIEKNGKVPDTCPRLSSPHFDELAVAFAQPVQPLAPPRWKRLLRSSLLLIAYLVFIVAVVAIANLNPPRPRADISSEAMSGETQSEVQPALDDTSSGMTPGESMAAPTMRRMHSRRVGRRHFPNQGTEIVE